MKEWVKINGRNPLPTPDLYKPVLVVCAPFIVDAHIEIMAWTGRGWSLRSPWDSAHKDGDDIEYWMPLPQMPNAELTGRGHES